jgi:ubiquinone biosynthesis protein
MSAIGPLAAVRDLGRARVIAGVLARHGFGDAAQRLGLAAAIARAGRVLHWKPAAALSAASSPQRACRALEELGPAFVKFGQLLSTRVDLFAPEWIAEFEKLQDQVPAVPFAELRPGLEAALGAKLEAVFPVFDEKPLAAGSIAQVHRARLADGREVVVKIRRPGIRPVVEADLRLLARLSETAARGMPELRRFRPRALVRQLSRSLRRELDLARECRTAERIAARLPKGSPLVIPQVHWEFTRETVNVQDFIAGIPGHDPGAAQAAGLDRRLLAQRGADAMLRMILVEGLFHADPHPGNVFYLPGNRFALIDFGMAGRLTEARRGEVAGLLDALARRDADAVLRALAAWAPGAEGDEGLREAVEEFIDRHHGVPLARLDLGGMLADVAALLRDHQVPLPPDLALLIKALITLEGLGRRLDPEFDMASAAAPLLRRALRDRYRPSALLRRGRRLLEETLSVARSAPRALRRLLGADLRGRPRITFDMPRLEGFGLRLDRAASRVTVGLVTAALIVGTSIVMTVKGGPSLLGLPLFGLLGFAGSALCGLWLMLSIWRSGHMRHRRGRDDDS